SWKTSTAPRTPLLGSWMGAKLSSICTGSPPLGSRRVFSGRGWGRPSLRIRLTGFSCASRVAPSRRRRTSLKGRPLASSSRRAAVESLPQTDVHQNQIGRRLADLLDGLSPARGLARHRISHPLQPPLQIQGHEALVLHDNHAGCAAHHSPPEAFAVFPTRE